MLRISLDTAQLQAKTDALVQQINNVIQAQIQYEGEELTSHARNLSPEESFKDHTGNLRSSIGFATYQNGRLTNKSYFQQVPPTEPAKENTVYDGAQQGEQSIENHKKAVTGCSHGLIVVAGMDYAKNVEAMENKNVLARTELKAVEDIKLLQKDIQQKIKQLLNK